jgi:hypothetical protein
MITGFGLLGLWALAISFAYQRGDRGPGDGAWIWVVLVLIVGASLVPPLRPPRPATPRGARPGAGAVAPARRRTGRRRATAGRARSGRPGAASRAGTAGRSGRRAPAVDRSAPGRPPRAVPAADGPRPSTTPDPSPWARPDPSDGP